MTADKHAARHERRGASAADATASGRTGADAETEREASAERAAGEEARADDERARDAALRVETGSDARDTAGSITNVVSVAAPAYVVDVAPLDQLIAIRQEQARLDQFRDRAGSLKAQVDEPVFRRVVEDYTRRHVALEERALPLKAQARSEYRTLRTWRAGVESTHEDARLIKQELQFRHAVGELDEGALTAQVREPDETLARCRAELESIDALHARFAEAFGSEATLDAEMQADDERQRSGGAADGTGASASTSSSSADGSFAESAAAEEESVESGGSWPRRVSATGVDGDNGVERSDDSSLPDASGDARGFDDASRPDSAGERDRAALPGAVAGATSDAVSAVSSAAGASAGGPVESVRRSPSGLWGRPASERVPGQTNRADEPSWSGSDARPASSANDDGTQDEGGAGGRAGWGGIQSGTGSRSGGDHGADSRGSAFGTGGDAPSTGARAAAAAHAMGAPMPWDASLRWSADADASETVAGWSTAVGDAPLASPHPTRKLDDDLSLADPFVARGAFHSSRGEPVAVPEPALADTGEDAVPASGGSTSPFSSAVLMELITSNAASASAGPDAGTVVADPSSDSPSVVRVGAPHRLEGSTTIGRADESQLRIVNPSVSRQHAVLTLTGEGYVIRDLHSQNGTFVNGERVDSSALHDGDQIVFGDATFLFRAGE